MPKKMIEIVLDKAKMQRIERMLRNIPRGMGTAMSRAINQTVKTARTHLARNVAKASGMKVGSARRAIKMERASKTRWIGTLKLYSSRLPLKLFGARQTGQGVAYKFGTGESGFIPHAFIQTMPRSGHQGVFIRRGMAEGLIVGDDELLYASGKVFGDVTMTGPIYEIYGPSVAAVFEGTAGFAKEAMSFANTKLEANIDNQVNYLLSQRGAA